MYGLKGKYYMSLIMKAIKDFILFETSRDISDYFYTVPDGDLLEITEIEPLFQFVGYCFIFSFFVLCIESIYYYYLK